MRQANFPTPWHVIHNGRCAAEFDSEATPGCMLKSAS